MPGSRSHAVVRNTARLALVLAAFATFACGPAGPTDEAGPAGELEQRVDAYFSPFLAARDFNGVVLIARGDEILLNKAYGVAGFERAARARPDTRYRVASLTKTFTSAAILSLRDEGLLALDDPLSRFLPGFPQGDSIRIEHLLAHSAGVPNPDNAVIFGGPIETDALVAHIGSKPLQFEPGTENRYSSGGYNLLAAVIEKASGSDYDTFVREFFFEPLGMRNTGNFADPSVSPPEFAEGYAPGPPPAGVVLARDWSPSAVLGSGSLYSTTGDLLLWARAVARKTLVDMDDLAWPYGWGKIQIAGHDGLEQTGSLPGYVASLSVFPDEEIFVVCLNNVETSAWAQWNRDLSSLAFGETVAVVRLPEAVEVPAAELARYAGTYRSERGETFRIVNDDGLFLFWNDSPDGKYITPTGEGRFRPRSIGGELAFRAGDGGAINAAEWNFGGDNRLAFVRIDRD